MFLINGGSMESTLIGCPRDCYDTCALRVYVSDNRIAKIEAVDNWYTGGILCPRAARDIERVYSPSRVLYPFISVNNGVFRRIDWDQALEILVSKLREVLEIHGPEKALFLEYAGNRGIITRYASRRLWNFLGVTQTDGSICDHNGSMALRYTYGSTYGAFPRDIDESKMIIAWGFNPAVSAIHLWRRVLEVKEKGGFIVTIDVRSTETAKQSSDFIKVKPGTDGYLALGIAKYIVEEDYVDKEFISKYTYGFNELVKHLEKYDLNIIEEITGVPKTKIIDLADRMHSNKPFTILIGYGLQRRYGGGETVRLISIIPALLGLHRAFFYSNTDGLPINLAEVDGSLAWNPRKIISMEKVGVELANGNYKFVHIHLHNPVATLPNAGKVVEGLRRNDVFVVVHETHWSDTAKLADLVLPAPTFYEKFDVVFSYTHNIVYLNKPAIDPLGESIGEYQLMCELTKRIVPSKYSDLCLEPIHLLKVALGNKNLDELLGKGFIELKPKPKSIYQTPSGKIEFHCSLSKWCRELNLPMREGIGGSSELVLVTSAHPLYIHTQFEDVYGSIKGELHVNPDDARNLDLSTGDLVEVYNDKGKVVMRAIIDPGLSKGVAWAPRQALTYSGERINILLNDDVDKYGGAVLNSTLIKIRKIHSPQEYLREENTIFK
jgi:anaerobic selenocysteine-containing dehydrogenase